MADPVSFLTGAANWLSGNLSANKSNEYKGSLKDFAEYAKQKYKEGKFGLTDYDKAFLYNSSIAAYQNDLALQNWNRENEYNSPESQMQRYLAAGLNPNLVYGAGASSGNAGNIGTPTVGGQISPTDIQDSRTRKVAQKWNAFQTALGMLGTSLDVFSKLMTVRGEIKRTNAENAAGASQGVFNRDYWTVLNTYGEGAPDVSGASMANLKGRQTVAQWMADASNSELANRIALYRTFNNGGLAPSEIENKPFYARELDAKLENSQADLTYQNLMNDFKSLEYLLANDPDFGLKRFKKTEYDILRSKLKVQNADLRLKRRIYNWMPQMNLSRILDAFIPF